MMPNLVATTTRIIEVNPLIAGLLMGGVFYLYWFVGNRPLTKLYVTYPPKISRILHGSEWVFWGVWVSYAIVATGWGIYSIFLD